MVEGADEVFTDGVVDACFSADGGIDHGEESGGDLEEGEAAEEGGGGEASHVADESAAEGEEGGVAVDGGGEELVVDGGEVLEGFMVFAGGDGGGDGLEAGGFEGGLEGGEVDGGDVGVGDDGDFGGAGEVAEVRADGGEEAGLDGDVVFVVGDIDADDSWCGGHGGIVAGCGGKKIERSMGRRERDHSRSVVDRNGIARYAQAALGGGRGCG